VHNNLPQALFTEERNEGPPVLPLAKGGPEGVDREELRGVEKEE